MSWQFFSALHLVVPLVKFPMDPSGACDPRVAPPWFFVRRYTVLQSAEEEEDEERGGIF